jgi:hypothetical protein
MKSNFKKLFLAVTIFTSIIACSGGDDSNNTPLNQSENQLVGTWEYRVTPHQSGVGGPNSFYRSYIILNADRTGEEGYEEYFSPTQQYSDSGAYTWSATNSILKRVSVDGTEEGEGRYELIDATHLKLFGSDGNQYSVDGIPVVFTKQ